MNAKEGRGGKSFQTSFHLVMLDSPSPPCSPPPFLFVIILLLLLLLYTSW